MNLAVVSAAEKSRYFDMQCLANKEKNFQLWMEHPTSSIVHHDSACCDKAKAWFLSLARSKQIGSFSRFELNAPTWLNEHFSWGPSSWPIAWCELVKEDVIDCGVFAALAREIFLQQGFSVHPGQALFLYNESCTAHWRELWREAEKKNTFPWVGKNIVYHEICLVESQDGHAHIYDPTFSLWHQSQQRLGFGSLLALRSECPHLLHVENQTISCGEWSEI